MNYGDVLGSVVVVTVHPRNPPDVGRTESTIGGDMKHTYKFHCMLSILEVRKRCPPARAYDTLSKSEPSMSTNLTPQFPPEHGHLPRSGRGAYSSMSPRMHLSSFHSPLSPMQAAFWSPIVAIPAPSRLTVHTVPRYPKIVSQGLSNRIQSWRCWVTRRNMCEMRANVTDLRSFLEQHHTAHPWS